MLLSFLSSCVGLSAAYPPPNKQTEKKKKVVRQKKTQQKDSLDHPPPLGCPRDRDRRGLARWVIGLVSTPSTIKTNRDVLVIVVVLLFLLFLCSALATGGRRRHNLLDSVVLLLGGCISFHPLAVSKREQTYTRVCCQPRVAVVAVHRRLVALVVLHILDTLVAGHYREGGPCQASANVFFHDLPLRVTKNCLSAGKYGRRFASSPAALPKKKFFFNKRLNSRTGTQADNSTTATSGT